MSNTYEYEKHKINGRPKKKLNNAVDKAEQKGVKESLIVMNDLALL